MKVLVIFAHPAYERSLINKQLVAGITGMDGVSFHDLYEEYPNFDVDIDREQERLSKHDAIVFMHPLFWYGSPAIIKQWQDLVLTHGWAYGKDGTNLKGKIFFQVITTGGPVQTYEKEGMHGHALSEFLLPIYRTAEFCQMRTLPHFGVHGTWYVSEEEMAAHQTNLRNLLREIVEGTISLEELDKRQNANLYYNEEH